ncbi:T9SS type A sorting domain-containing protein [Dyadobacter sp. LJ53]|uniref:T9SS type A sorting domain-containing protein n=1 Tax=Dyadobacter chenwenxiniae TaxID=2906456 RepID=UPI001F2B2830|nr:T9SS type A sorting domain-containing protein [Dyadobacter chenwenxiniae]MCF0049151.1 T9SS type A sorting domain-containing protein [Dyadobacter chenwenxiniae]
MVTPIFSQEPAPQAIGAATILITSTWTGAIDNNWDNAGNWSSNVVPDVYTDVEIAYQGHPVVSANSAARNVSILAGGSLTVSSGAAFTIAGKLTGPYVANAPDALTIFSSSEPQEIQPGTYANVRISGGNKTISGYNDLIVNGNFDFESGKVLLDYRSVHLGPAATISNFDKDKYFVVDYFQGGGLIRDVGSVEKIFPIGTSAGFTPMTIVHHGDPSPILALVLDGAYKHFNGGDAQGPPFASGVVNKTWFVFEGIGGVQYGKVSFTVQWNGTDEKPLFDREKCALATILGNSMWSYWQFDELMAAGGSDPYTLSRSNVEMGRFAVASEETLPVRLVKFEASQENKSTSLNWLTADAVNVSHFEVEKSLDGKSFTKILEEQYLEGKHAYHVIDPDISQGLPADGAIYYRLKMVDKDDTFAYSRIVSIHSNSSQTQVTFGSPNPFSNKVTVQVPWALSKHSKVTLKNISGQNISMRKVVLLKNEVDIEVDQALPAGQYVLTIQDKDTVRSVKLVKQ